jgi:serine/threonine protein kinase
MEGSGMHPDRWRQISEVYHAALTRPERDRAGFLREACAGDDSLHREVASLLTNESSAASFLAEPALAVAAGIVTNDGGTILTGRRIGVYQLHSLLGAGGMGEVYRARDTKLGRDVAFKILPRVFTADPDRLARFEREARVLASLNHPHIGAIYGFEESDGVRALVLELIEGETLAERIQQVSRLKAQGSGLPLREALTIAIRIASALDTAHRAGIVHRDLKPGNIILVPGGRAVITDFGLSRPAVSSGHSTVEAIGAGTPTFTPIMPHFISRANCRAW